jgi:hypothetical protein
MATLGILVNQLDEYRIRQFHDLALRLVKLCEISKRYPAIRPSEEHRGQILGILFKTLDNLNSAAMSLLGKNRPHMSLLLDSMRDQLGKVLILFGEDVPFSLIDKGVNIPKYCNNLANLAVRTIISWDSVNRYLDYNKQHNTMPRSPPIQNREGITRMLKATSAVKMRTSVGANIQMISPELKSFKLPEGGKKRLELKTSLNKPKLSLPYAKLFEGEGTGEGYSLDNSGFRNRFSCHSILSDNSDRKSRRFHSRGPANVSIRRSVSKEALGSDDEIHIEKL